MEFCQLGLKLSGCNRGGCLTQWLLYTGLTVLNLAYLSVLDFSKYWIARSQKVHKFTVRKLSKRGTYLTGCACHLVSTTVAWSMVQDQVMWYCGAALARLKTWVWPGLRGGAEKGWGLDVSVDRTWTRGWLWRESSDMSSAKHRSWLWRSFGGEFGEASELTSAKLWRWRRRSIRAEFGEISAKLRKWLRRSFGVSSVNLWRWLRRSVEVQCLVRLWSEFSEASECPSRLP